MAKEKMNKARVALERFQEQVKNSHNNPLVDKNAQGALEEILECEAKIADIQEVKRGLLNQLKSNGHPKHAVQEALRTLKMDTEIALSKRQEKSDFAFNVGIKQTQMELDFYERIVKEKAKDRSEDTVVKAAKKFSSKKVPQNEEPMAEEAVH